MKLRTLILSGAALVAGAIAAAAALQEGAIPMVKPGPEHELLKKRAGTWDAEVDFMGQMTKGTYTSKLALGDMWLVSDYQGSMMGGAFLGHEILGWDSQKKKYVSCWVDSMSTALAFSEGSWDEASKTMTMTGDSVDPTGQTMKTVSVTKMIDPDHTVWQMHMGSADTPPMMTIKYTRKK